MTYGTAKNFQPSSMGWNVAVATTNSPNVKGYLLAWDPVKQQVVWRADHLGPWNGGVLTTAGNLVVQGDAAGALNAYRADTGTKLWSMSVQSPVIAAPMTYEVDGTQYIAVLAGWGGAYPLLEGKDSAKSGNTRNISRIVVFTLGATAALPPPPPESVLPNVAPTPTASPATLASGEALFGQYCGVCHGEAAIAGGIVPDLRRSPFVAVDAWYSIVLDGVLQEGGMAAFSPVLDHAQASAIRDYVRRRALEDGLGAGDTASHPPDAKRGATIVAHGTASGATACAACHGLNGDSVGGGAFPRVGGQGAPYLSKQLQDFKSRARTNAIMAPIADTLSADDIRDVAAYFASVESALPPLPRGNAQLVDKGRALAESGNATKGVPACNACHGVGGVGEAPTIPYLAGQYASYTASQLQAWRKGSRRSSLEAMRLFATKLDDQEIDALAAYYQQARTPAVAAASAAAPAKH